MMTVATTLLWVSLAGILFLLLSKKYELSFGKSLIPRFVHDPGERIAARIQNAFHRFISYLNKKTALLFLHFIIDRVAHLLKSFDGYVKESVQDAKGTQKRLGNNGNSSTFLHEVSAHKRKNGGGKIEESE